jgi:SAM-dependent methyltransferase
MACRHGIPAIWICGFFGAPYVPAKLRHVRLAFDELYPISPDDVLVDLGSGDGKVLREVSRRGGRAVGVELNPILAAVSRLMSRADKAVSVRLGSMWLMPFPADTTVVYIFGTSRDIGRIERKISKESARLKRPLYVLSYGFKLPHARLVKQNSMHHLYKITPLQSKKHKV